MTHYDYRSQGTCARAIHFDITDGNLSNVSFDGGCNGNLKAIGLLLEGSDARSAANTLRGNICGMRSTSCADQLSKAIDLALVSA